jgi:S1-C subfamily serine protease
VLLGCSNRSEAGTASQCGGTPRPYPADGTLPAEPLPHTAPEGTLIARVVLVTALVALAVGFAAGLGGGMLASRLGGRPAASAPATTAGDTQAAIRAAVDRAQPSVVLILAESAAGQDIGTGIVVSQSGHILTASHVIRGASRVTVYLPSGEERPARLLADDSPFTDAAMLQVAPQGLRAATLGASEALRPGDFVLALAGGTGQFGRGTTTALGVVSATGRTLPRSGVTFEDLIQTDATINSGDSGGALVNLRGEVVGLLTTVIRSGPGGAEVRDVGFAQSIDSLRPVVAAMVGGSRFPRARIGIERPEEQHIEIDPDLATQRRLPVQQGALVTAPAPGSPAAKAGITSGDIVVGVNGQPVTYEVPMVNLLKQLPRGARVDLAVLRAGRTITVQLTPEE